MQRNPCFRSGEKDGFRMNSITLVDITRFKDSIFCYRLFIINRIRPLRIPIDKQFSSDSRCVRGIQNARCVPPSDPRCPDRFPLCFEGCCDIDMTNLSFSNFLSHLFAAFVDIAFQIRKNGVIIFGDLSIFTDRLGPYFIILTLRLSQLSPILINNTAIFCQLIQLFLYRIPALFQQIDKPLIFIPQLVDPDHLCPVKALIKIIRHLHV